MPAADLLVPQIEALCQVPPSLWPPLRHDLSHLCPALEVPLGHSVRECVVIHALVVLIRADHKPDVVAPVCLLPPTAGPEAGRLEHDLRSRLAQEVIVGRCLPVLP